jgi:hypothetical protein
VSYYVHQGRPGLYLEIAMTETDDEIRARLRSALPVVDTIQAAAYALEMHAPYRPHAVIGVLGDGSTGVLRLAFTEPATAEEVAYVVDVVSDYVPLPLYVETVWTPRHG